MFKFSKRSEQGMEGIDERLIEIAHKALSISKIDFGIPEYGGIRSESEQHKLFVDGKSQLDGRHKKSYHQSGLALDVYAYVEGKASWDTLHMSQIACAFLQAANILGYSLEWGGLWVNFIDMPHFEMKSDDA